MSNIDFTKMRKAADIAAEKAAAEQAEQAAVVFKQTALDDTRPLQERFDALLGLLVR